MLSQKLRTTGNWFLGTDTKTNRCGAFSSFVSRNLCKFHVELKTGTVKSFENICQRLFVCKMQFFKLSLKLILYKFLQKPGIHKTGTTFLWLQKAIFRKDFSNILEIYYFIF